MKKVILLGSTGSIGTQTLDLVQAARSRFEVVALSARRDWQTMARQVELFSPAVVGMVDNEAAERLAEVLPKSVALVRGADCVQELVEQTDYDLCVHGIVGAAGVRPSEGVLLRGKTLALANKESLVVAGAHLMQLSRSSGASILPVDSEHAAIYQCLHGEELRTVRKIILTASGGGLRDHPVETLASIPPSAALKHPTWSMGQRITVDSATLMNKALEIIEAHHLYALRADQIEVVLHRQSIVHSMVEFNDGSVIAQMGPPDMRGPIHFALNHPHREPNSLIRGFDLDSFSELTFEAPDLNRYPSLELGYQCVREGGDSGAVLNAADEIAVQAFLDEKIGFQDIARINRSVLEDRSTEGIEDPGLEALLRSDASARRQAQVLVEQLVGVAR